MIGDSELPPGWQGSYGTINTRQALADIDARLRLLERRPLTRAQRFCRWLRHVVNANPFVTPWQSRRVERLDLWLKRHSGQQTP